MRRSGKLVQWNNNAGFGFVRDSAGNDFYVHISKLKPEQPRPRVGDTLEFALVTGRKGRPAASDITVTPAAAPPPDRGMRDVTRPPPGVSRYTIGLRVVAATMMTLLLLLAMVSQHAPVWLGATYALMGAASALLYRFDKLYALSGRWRVSETNLHVVDLCFGIIGGLAAQELYRHKTVKPAFVATTWAIALLHLVGITAVALGWFNAALAML
ncbi:DUF1294 domain-containing protein [Devosia aquimaris]|uniref:DUF1294 domain-containing protein n=1 Tax=Devosia aquimaris TaxID=2866214 RepID=UPI001CD157D0|nr:DUF1294 domain-containing protein [Devosia sp. CJK-A8-3]